ncbi:hypothetical protein SAMN05880561_11014 [Rhizobium sp. RU33A]|uniref:hypothetical protein n=1 Tax=Rhizobium sp. RU33A TaxID=1907413 RepID=UPI0009553629|nr:hypothetical protein [Rhizobium sp. RU33A]SIR12066.1 hypothetical protein SAMN05880561_11014 [Rhizobium sp. RU33A]
MSITRLKAKAEVECPTRPDQILQAGLPLRSGLVVVLCGRCCGHFDFAPVMTFELFRHIVCVVDVLGLALPLA